MPGRGVLQVGQSIFREGVYGQRGGGRMLELEGNAKHRLREVISGIRKVNVLFDAMDITQRTSEGVTVQYEREEDQLPISDAKGIRQGWWR